MNVENVGYTMDLESTILAASTSSKETDQLDLEGGASSLPLLEPPPPPYLERNSPPHPENSL